MLGAYRFLSLNHSYGDQIYIFGFSRGAFLARGLASFISTVGLMTHHGFAAGQSAIAVATYLESRGIRTDFTSLESIEEFARRWTRPAHIAFLGVFDTVGEIGIGDKGRAVRRYDTRLHPAVRVARQALAIDEHRTKFVPQL